jgi:hypothetical protein
MVLRLNTRRGETSSVTGPLLRVDTRKGVDTHMDRNSRNDRQETGTTGCPGSNMKGRRQEHPGTLFNFVVSYSPSRDRGMWRYKKSGRQV